jgi:hypothetical protein
VKKVLVAIALVVLFCVSASAQTALRVYIPFQFRAGDQALPAGDYRVNLDVAAGRVMLVLEDGTAGGYLPVRTALRTGFLPETGMLVFHRYANLYFLRNLWRPAQSTGYELPRSKAEREMARVAGPVQIASVRAVK